MYYQPVELPGSTKKTINRFLGYNHNSQIKEGEFYDMKNLCSDEYPALTPRKKRTCILSIANKEWERIAIQVEVTEEENKIIYCLGRIKVKSKEKLSLYFVKDETIAQSTEAIIVFNKGEKNEEVSVYIDVDGEKTEIEVPENANEIQITIKATLLAKGNESIKAIKDIEIKRYNEKIRGMLLKDGKMAYMVGTKLYYGTDTFDFADYIGEPDHETKQQLISYGAYILVFPLGLYLNTNTSEFGELGARYRAGFCENKVTFSMSDANGSEMDISTEKPDAPKNGDYWMDTSGEKPAMYRYSEGMDMWVGVSTTYTKIYSEFHTVTENPFPEMFETGDTVFINAGGPEFEKGCVIVNKGQTKNDSGEITGGYIVVKGIVEGVLECRVNEEETIIFERKIPKVDYVCIANNRVWGCYKGKNEDGKSLNEIYASKLGDAKNWFTFEGAATDSYTLSLGDDGEFTGAFMFQGYPMFFKENIIYKIYGAYPAAYQLKTYNCRGVQKGCSGSIAVVNEYLMYKSVSDFCVFDGTTPTGVSHPLGNTRYFDVNAGASIGKYYASAVDKDGKDSLLLFDIDKGIWHKEDGLRIEEFCYNNSGELYGRNGLSVYGFANAKSELGQVVQESEKFVEWMAVTGEMETEYTERKYIRAIHIRAMIAITSEITIYISCDDEDYIKIITLKGDGKNKTYRIPLNVKRNHHFRIKLEGKGECRIESIVKEIEKGSDRT